LRPIDSRRDSWKLDLVSEHARYAWQLAGPRLALLSALLVAVTWTNPAPAQSDPEVRLQAAAGFDGYYKDQYWIPVQIELANTGLETQARVELSQRPISTGQATNYDWSISLAAVARKRTTLYLFPDGATRSIELELTTDGEPISSFSLPLTRLASSDTLIGVMASDPTPFNVLRSGGGSGAARVEVAQLVPETLPDQSSGLSALDAIIVSDLDTGVLTVEQRQALSGWVAAGGHLLIGGGAHWQKSTAGLTDLIPMSVTGEVTLSNVDELDQYFGTGLLPTGSALVPVAEPLENTEILVAQEGYPLVLTRLHGLGQVAFLAVDPATPPLRDHPSMETLYQVLLLSGPDRPLWASGQLEGYAASAAASTFPNLSLPSVGAVCGFFSLYAFALGPLHYIVLRRAKRREVAWITIPALVLLFSGVAFSIGSASRGNRPVLNRIGIVHVAEGEQYGQLTGLVAVFSPGRRSLEVTLPTGLLARPLSSDYSVTGGDWQYSYTDQGLQLTDSRYDVDAVKGLLVQGEVPSPRLISEISAEPTGSTLTVAGTVTSVDLALQHATLLTPYGTVALGDMAVGEPRTIRTELDRSATLLDSGAILDALGVGADPYYDYYSGQSGSWDAAAIRRSNLIEAALLATDGLVWPGIYLAGWSDTSPAEVELSTSSDLAGDLTLYLVELEAGFWFEADGLGVPTVGLPEVPQLAPTSPASGGTIQSLNPEAFTWQLTQWSPASPTPSPYGAQVTQGSFSVAFYPATPIQFGSVEALILHLWGSLEGAQLEELVFLWDYPEGRWVNIPGLFWGDNTLADPFRYVDQEGMILLRVESAREGVLLIIERADFTLVVGP